MSGKNFLGKYTHTPTTFIDSGKRRTKRQWDEEWGDPDTEGNLWWLGSLRANWEDVMGHNPLWWICERSTLILYPVA